MPKHKQDFPYYYIDEKIRRKLDEDKEKVLKYDWDRVFIVDGQEGSGKSLLALQLGYYLDSSLTLDRVTFNAEAFASAIDDAEKGQAVIFDEAFNGLSSSAATSRMNRFLVRKLMECRQKNLFIIIVLPTIFMLQKYAGIHRSSGLFHVYANKRGERGFYKYYNRKNKKILYLSGNKYYEYHKPRIPYSFLFYSRYPKSIDEKEYRQKKLTALHESDEKSDESKMDAYRTGLFAYVLKKRYKMTYREQAKLLKDLGLTLHVTNLQRKALKIHEKCKDLHLDI